MTESLSTRGVTKHMRGNLTRGVKTTLQTSADLHALGAQACPLLRTLEHSPRRCSAAPLLTSCSPRRPPGSSTARKRRQPWTSTGRGPWATRRRRWRRAASSAAWRGKSQGDAMRCTTRCAWAKFVFQPYAKSCAAPGRGNGGVQAAGDWAPQRAGVAPRRPGIKPGVAQRIALKQGSLCGLDAAARLRTTASAGELSKTCRKSCGGRIASTRQHEDRRRPREWLVPPVGGFYA